MTNTTTPHRSPTTRPRSLTAAVFVWLFLLVPAARGEVVIDEVSPKLSVAGSLRARWELWNWFEPRGTQENDYDFLATVAKLGVRWKDDAFEAFLEGQNSALIDLPSHAFAPPPEGNLGLGGNYYQHNKAHSDASVFVKQGYLTVRKLGVPGLSLKGGRFEFSEGNEMPAGEPTVDWVKNARVAQRLIGPFGWSHVGRAFDGGVVAYDRKPFNVTVMASHPTQGGFDLKAIDEIDDIDLAYAALNYLHPAENSTTDMRLFYIYYEDRRHQLKTDNRPQAVRNDPAERYSNITIHTEGAHVVHAFKTERGILDFLLWGVLQEGDWGKLEHTAWAWNTELGFQPATKCPMKPWVRIGYTRSSGDEKADDEEHGTFFQILPTVRPHSLTTFYNMMNSEDGFAQLILRPMPGLVSRTDYHYIRVTEPNDLWYQGSGATLGNRDRPEGFGYAGRPAGGHRALLQYLDTSLGYDWNAYLNTNVYYAHVFGADVVESIFQEDDADFGYLEVTVKF